MHIEFIQTINHSLKPTPVVVFFAVQIMVRHDSVLVVRGGISAAIYF
jgi:hypothetical protein